MKVLEATDFYFPWIGGPSRFIENLALGLGRRGHDTLIVCPSPTARPACGSGPPGLARVRTWPVPFGFNLRAGLPLHAVESLVRRWRPDVIHVHHPFGISLAAWAAACRHGIPVVATNHTIPACSLYGLRRTVLHRPATAVFGAYLTWFLRRADAVATPTETAARMISQVGYHGPVIPISNGIDTRRFRPGWEAAESPAMSPRENNEPVVLYTGRLDAEKDMQTWIAAIPHVLRQRRARFVIGGEGADRPRLERLVRDLGVSAHVAFPGYAGESDLPALYRSASIYAISSPVELQSISTLEAMASGLPIVGVDAGALPELVRPRVNGALSPPGQAEAFAGAIVDVLADEDRRAAMGRASRAIAETHGLESMVDAYEKLLGAAVMPVHRSSAVALSHG